MIYSDLQDGNINGGADGKGFFRTSVESDVLSPHPSPATGNSSRQSLYQENILVAGSVGDPEL